MKNLKRYEEMLSFIRTAAAEKGINLSEIKNKPILTEEEKKYLEAEDFVFWAKRKIKKLESNIVHQKQKAKKYRNIY